MLALSNQLTCSAFGGSVGEDGARASALDKAQESVMAAVSQHPPMPHFNCRSTMVERRPGLPLVHSTTLIGPEHAN